MRTSRRLMIVRAWAFWAALTIGASAYGDGMIVPVRPEHRVVGSWAVKYHHVDIKVRDQVASVSIDQEFVNTSSGMIEVEYIFPVPGDAAIDSMTLMVNGKEYAANLLKADEARRIYEDIVRTKKDPALLEYVSFGMYRTKAFPLEPNKPARVLVTYKNVCKKDRSLTEVWYPLNTEKFSAKAIEDVAVKVDIKAEADISAVYSPTHDLTVKREDSRHFIASYQARNTLPVADFQLFYRTGDQAVGAMLMTYQPAGARQGYLLVLASPTPQAAEKAIPKDVVVVMDRSGSMSGEKLDQARKAVKFVLNRLNKDDRFATIAYSDGVEALQETLVPAGEQQVKKALDQLDDLDARGGTNIDAALSKAMEMMAGPEAVSSEPYDGPAPAKRPKYVLFFTDGLPTVGKTDEGQILADTQKANPGQVRLFAFGVGYDVNTRLLDKLVGQNNGKSDYVKPKEDIEAKIASLYSKIRNPVMTDVKVSIAGLKIKDPYPQAIGDLFDGDQLVLAGRYEVDDLADFSVRESGVYQTQLVITGMFQGSQKGFEYPVTIQPSGGTRFAFVEKIWAMRRIGFLLDEIQLHGKSGELMDEVIRLSKQYGIMTPYTSFLADERTPLAPRTAEERAVVSKFKSEAEGQMAKDFAGEAGQRSAIARQELNQAKSLGAAAARPASAAPAGPGPADTSSAYTAVITGNSKQDTYEAGKKELAGGVRQIGNQALYLRNGIWVSPDTAALDVEKDKDQIKVIDRFSDDYFELVRANNVTENQLLASQNNKEQLLVKYRGQAYLIR